MVELILFFFAIVIFGDAALIALIYYAMSGEFSVIKIALLGVTATVATDCLWYCLGKWFPSKKVLNFLKLDKFEEKYPKFFNFFSEHGLKAVFYSKFIVGLRTPIRALYGARNLPIIPFIAVNFLSAVLWISIIALLSAALEISLPDLENTLQKGILIFSTVSIVVMFMYLVGRKYAAKKYR